jgi:hypothetical protein
MASFIYLISEAERGPVKIGHAKDPASRLCDIQIGNPRPLRLVNFWRVHCGPTAEDEIHRSFHGKHMRGEWFACSEKSAASRIEKLIGRMEREHRRIGGDYKDACYLAQLNADASGGTR